MIFPSQPPCSRGAATGMTRRAFFEQFDLVSDALRPAFTVRFYQPKWCGPCRCRVIWCKGQDTISINGKGATRAMAFYDALYSLGVSDVAPDLPVEALLQQIAQALPDKIVYLNHAEA